MIANAWFKKWEPQAIRYKLSMKDCAIAAFRAGYRAGENDTITATEADRSWLLKSDTVKTECLKGHIAARMSAGTWLTTRAAMTARYGPQPSAFDEEEK